MLIRKEKELMNLLIIIFIDKIEFYQRFKGLSFLFEIYRYLKLVDIIVLYIAN